MRLLALTTLLNFVVVVSGTSQQWTADWKSLENRAYPEWFDDAKLGIFIHWGVYSVPAIGCDECYSEWFLRGLQLHDTLRVNHMKKYFGEDFKYKDFAPLFKAELFDPDEWASLFEKAGARYVIFVSKHHDGFAMWPSKYAPGWNSQEVGPKKDLVGELSNAIRRTDLKMGLYYSLPEWNNPLHRWDTDPDRNIGRYVEEHMIPQFKELVSTYKPDLLFADGEWNNTAEEWHSAELISWYYNLVGDQAIVNNRWGSGSTVGFLTPEYSAGISIKDRPWAECRGLGRSFGLNRAEKLDAYMTPEELIHFFIKAVSNGGGITLNVGPKADGQIPLLQQERLLQLGKWIRANDEAIYGSRAWEKTGEVRKEVVTRIDKTIDFDWVRNKPIDPISEDNFTVTWIGNLIPQQSDEYQFEGMADDEMQIYVDKKLVFDSNSTTENSSVLLKKDKRYEIEVIYKEKDLQASVQLRWTGKDKASEVIPSSVLSYEGQPGLLGEYSSMNQYMAYTTNNGFLYAITMEWPGDYLEIPIKKPADGASLYLLGHENPLPWHYRSGKVILDVREIGIKNNPGEYAWTFKIPLEK